LSFWPLDCRVASLLAMTSQVNWVNSITKR
jgi:hypothetical protein